MRRVSSWLLLAVWVLPVADAACGPTPVGPSSPPAPPVTARPSEPNDVPRPLPSPTPLPSPASIASLAIEDPYVSQYAVEWQPELVVRIRFLLRELSGNSGATIRSIVMGNPSLGFDTFGGFCADGMRVPPGEVLDTFYNDESFAALTYCAPGFSVSAPAQPHPFVITVDFVDDEGREGRVVASAVWR